MITTGKTAVTLAASPVSSVTLAREAWYSA
jgi:hypothetical protein